MDLVVDGRKLYYEMKGEGDCILFLHGWGGGTISFEGAARIFAKTNKIINLDFAGFGNSPSPLFVYNLDNYVHDVLAILQHCKVNTNITVVGHSFGGRVGIKLAAQRPDLVTKLVLVDSAGVKPRFSLKKAIKVCQYKNAKKKGKDLSQFGSSDYKLLNDTMKKIFVNIVNEDLSSMLPQIPCKTLLVWGGKDKDTPMYMARKMHRSIKNSRLVVYKESGHYCYLDNFNNFIVILDRFVKGDLWQ